jgi:hypothetical protein
MKTKHSVTLKKSKTRRGTQRQRVSEDWADEIVAKLMAEGPALSKAQLMQGEETTRKNGVARRCALATLTMSGKKLIESVQKDAGFAEALVATIETRKALFAHLEGERELLDAAFARCVVAVATRDDIEELYKKVRRDLRPEAIAR